MDCTEQSTVLDFRREMDFGCGVGPFTDILDDIALDVEDWVVGDDDVVVDDDDDIRVEDVESSNSLEWDAFSLRSEDFARCRSVRKGKNK